MGQYTRRYNMSSRSCPICGKRISEMDEYCPNCKNPLVNDGSIEESRIVFRKKILARGIRNSFIFGIILVIIWETVTRFVSVGWPMATVNISAFIISLWIFLWPLFSFLKVSLPIWLAGLTSILCWVLLFVGLRSLLALIF